MVMSLRSKWAVDAIRRGTFRRVFATCGTVGTRSRAIRGSTSDDRVGCSASDGRCAPARPALHVSTRLLLFPPMRARECRLYSALSIIAPHCERAAPDALELHLRSEALHRMSLPDNLRRFARSASLPCHTLRRRVETCPPRIARERVPSVPTRGHTGRFRATSHQPLTTI